MTALIEHDQFCSTSTGDLADLYRAVREMELGDLLDPWRDVEAAAARELRVRVAADWLHRNWCLTESCTKPVEHLVGHEQAARAIVEAFEVGGDLTGAVYRGMYPHGPITAWDTAALSRHGAFQALVGHLVAVVPSEVTA